MFSRSEIVETTPQMPVSNILIFAPISAENVKPEVTGKFLLIFDTKDGVKEFYIVHQI